MRQTPDGVIGRPAYSDFDRHAPDCRHLRSWRRVQQPRWTALWVPARLRRPEGGQLLQCRRQRLRLCRGPDLPVGVDDDDDGDRWWWTTDVVVWSSQPSTNCHNRRLVAQRCDVAVWRGSTNHAPYVVAFARSTCHRPSVCLSVRRTEPTLFTRHCRTFNCQVILYLLSLHAMCYSANG